MRNLKSSVNAYGEINVCTSKSKRISKSILMAFMDIHTCSFFWGKCFAKKIFPGFIKNCTCYYNIISVMCTYINKTCTLNPSRNSLNFFQTLEQRQYQNTVSRKGSIYKKNCMGLRPIF